MMSQILRLLPINAAALLSLLLNVSIVTGQGSTGVYSIYTLPPFAITLYSGWTITDSELPTTASALQSIVQSYLYDYFHASSLQSELEAELNPNSDTNNGTTAISLANMVLHSVELQVSVRMIDSVRIWAELYGNVAFLEPASQSSQSRPTPQQMHDLMDSWIAKAFDPQTSLGIFRQRLITKANDNLVLLNLKTVEVTFDVQAGPPPPMTTPTQQQPPNGTWSTPEYVLMGTLLFFIASVGAAIYIFVNMERFKYRRDHEFESLQRQADQVQQLQHEQYFSDHHLPPNGGVSTSDSYDQYYTGSPDGRDVVPIVNADGSRRYVDPSYPQQLYYGASHLHMERDALEHQYYNTSGTMDPFRILVPSWVSRLDLMTRIFGQSQQEVDDDDLPFVYRDFPRHDGTPCLIYNPTVEEVQIEFDHDDNDEDDDDAHSNSQSPYKHSPVSAFAIDMGDMVGFSIKHDDDHDNDDKPLPSNSMHSTNSKKSISSTNSLEQFIERLENLYQFKHKQYKQRMEMERERRERKLSKKTRAVSVSSQTSMGDVSSSTTTPPPPTSTLAAAPVAITFEDSGIDTPLKAIMSHDAPCTPDTVSTTMSSVSYDSCIQTPPPDEVTMVMA